MPGQLATEPLFKLSMKNKIKSSGKSVYFQMEVDDSLLQNDSLNGHRPGEILHSGLPKDAQHLSLSQL